METYSSSNIISSCFSASTLNCALPTEAIQMNNNNNIHEGLFRNYLPTDHHHQSHISSSSKLSHQVLLEDNNININMAVALNSGDYSGITSENINIIDHHDHMINNIGHKKRAIFDQVEGEEEGEDDDDDDDDKERNNIINGGKKKKKGEKKVRRPRFAFQTRSQVDILDDGYRWRKYGQKAVKNNNFPRSYYRCTHQGCNVKKQVQRLSKDEEVVVTTYEGVHTHPIERNNDNFEQILNQMQIYTRF